MDVPVRMLKGASSFHAARISTPGAVMFGLRISGALMLGPRLDMDAIRGEGGVRPMTVPWNAMVATGDACCFMQFRILRPSWNVTDAAGMK
jgi:hypothetical protein